MRTAGVDLARLDRDLSLHGGEIDAIVGRNEAESAKLALQGTPGLVIGRFVIPGALGLANLRTVVRLSEAPAGDKKS